MSAPAPAHGRVRFGAFELDLHSGELWSNGRRSRLADQPFQVLRLLLEHPGQVVTRQDLRQKLWPADTFVDFDHSVNAAVKRLREALGDSAEHPQFVETLPKRGYRLMVGIKQPQKHAARGWKVAGAGVTLATLVALAAFLAWHQAPQPASAGRVMLAVLPLENLSGDPEQEFFSDGLTEELITRLGRLNAEQLGVIARTSAMQYKRTQKSVAEIGRELGVDYILEGSVRREGGRVMVNLRLIRVADQTQQWSSTYETQHTGIVALQGRIAPEIAQQARVAIATGEQAHLAALRPVNPAAHELYFRGRYHMNRRGEGPQELIRARDYFERSLEQDATYAPAYSGLADAYLSLTYRKIVPREEALRVARSSTLKALELDSSLGEAHASLAMFKEFEHDWAGAETEYRRAIQLNQNYAQVHHWYSQYLSEVGRHDEAIAEIRRAHELDPLSPRTWTEGDVLVFARRYDEAIAYAQGLLELDPNDSFAYRTLMAAYYFKGDFDRHMQAWSKVVLLERLGTPESLARGTNAYRRGGIKAAAREALAQAKRENWGPVRMARIHMRLGQYGEALRYLEEAVEQEETPGVNWLKVDPEWDPLRSRPRFQALLRRMNLPE